MSKSLGNAIGIKDPAPDMYGKLMSISDDLMWRYWTFLTDKKQSEIDAMQARVTSGELHPMQAKKDLAHAITTDFNSAEQADKAADAWAKEVQQKGVADDAPEVSVSISTEGFTHISDAETQTVTVRMSHLLVLAGLASSAGEATRKLNEKAVSINGEKSNSRFLPLKSLGEAPVLRLGKKQVKVKWTE
jgi:tyrosyl-tRNA synthetase